MNSLERDETQETVLFEVHSHKCFEMDDKLYLKIDDNDHLVDSIVHFKKSKLGVPQFRLSMCCACCQDRLYWFSKSKIEQCGCQALVDLS